VQLSRSLRSGRDADPPLSATDKQLLWDGMAAATLISIDQHAELLRGAGFEIESTEG
jgi:hypothetical protein